MDFKAVSVSTAGRYPNAGVQQVTRDFIDSGAKSWEKIGIHKVSFKQVETDTENHFR